MKTESLIRDDLIIDFDETRLLLGDDNDEGCVHIALRESPWLKDFADSHRIPGARDYRINLDPRAEYFVDDEILITYYQEDGSIDSVSFIPLLRQEQKEARLSFEKQLEENHWPSVRRLIHDQGGLNHEN